MLGRVCTLPLLPGKKEPACQCRRRKRRKRRGFDPWVWEVPWRRKWQPTPVFLPGKSYGQSSLVGYIHRVAKSPTQLSTDTHSHTHSHTVTHSHTYTDTHTLTYTHTVTLRHTHTLTDTHTHTLTHSHTQTRTHRLTHTHTHTHPYRCGADGSEPYVILRGPVSALLITQSPLGCLSSLGPRSLNAGRWRQLLGVTLIPYRQFPSKGRKGFRVS